MIHSLEWNAKCYAMKKKMFVNTIFVRMSKNHQNLAQNHSLPTRRVSLANKNRQRSRCT